MNKYTSGMLPEEREKREIVIENFNSHLDFYFEERTYSAVKKAMNRRNVRKGDIKYLFSRVSEFLKRCIHSIISNLSETVEDLVLSRMCSYLENVDPSEGIYIEVVKRKQKLSIELGPVTEDDFTRDNISIPVENGCFNLCPEEEEKLQRLIDMKLSMVGNPSIEDESFRTRVVIVHYDSLLVDIA